MIEKLTFKELEPTSLTSLIINEFFKLFLFIFCQLSVKNNKLLQTRKGFADNLWSHCLFMHACVCMCWLICGGGDQETLAQTVQGVQHPTAVS